MRSIRSTQLASLAGQLRPLALATLACALTTLVASGLLLVFDLSNVVTLFLLTAVFVALKLGRAAGIWAAVLCVGCFDFFFVEPRFTFAVSDAQYVFTLILLLVAALTGSELATRLRCEAAVAQRTLVRMEGEKLRNAVLAAVSHDLKTPLTAIRGLAEVLEQPGRLDANEQVDIARSIRMQAEEQHRLVMNLLDLARLQSEGVRLNRQWHPLGEIVGTALTRSTALLAGRRIHARVPPDLPLVEVDGLLLERVLVNLLENAGKYTDAAATVLVRAAASQDWIHVFVEDDGPGLPVDAESLFEPFMRGRKESSIAGVGLGLTLCRSIVAAHGGTIRGEQRMPRGARFEIRLPLSAPPEIEIEAAA